MARIEIAIDKLYIIYSGSSVLNAYRGIFDFNIPKKVLLIDSGAGVVVDPDLVAVSLADERLIIECELVDKYAG